MAQALHNSVQWDPGRNGDRRPAMPEPMWRDHRHPRRLTRPPQQRPDAIRVPVPAVATFPDEVVIMPERTEMEALFELYDPVTAERRRRFFHQLYAPTGTRLGSNPRAWYAFPVHCPRGVDADDAGIEVEVGPGEGEGFPQAAEGVEEETK